MLNLAVHRVSTEINRTLFFGLAYSAYNLASFVSGPVVDALNIDWKPQVTSRFGLFRLTGNRFVLLTCCLGSFLGLIVTSFYYRESRSTSHVLIDNNHDNEIGNTAPESTLITPENSSERTKDRHRRRSTARVKALIATEIAEEEAAKVEAANAMIDMENDTDHRVDSRGHIEKEEKKKEMEEKNEVFPSSTSMNGSKSRTESRDSVHAEQMCMTRNQSDDPSVSLLESVDATQPTEEKPLTYQQIWNDTIIMCKTRTFWRFAALNLSLVGVNGVFIQFDAAFPTYLVREFGEGVPKGTIFAINPFIVVCLTPIVACITSQYNHYDMIKLGTAISSIGLLFPVFSTSLWASVCMVVVFSLGEAAWAPRVQDYTLTVAPEGREATFMALSNAPMLLAQVPLGLMSGVLISDYVPNETDGSHTLQHPRVMWLIFGVFAMSSPLIMFLFESFIREPDKTANDTSINATESSGELIKGSLVSYLCISVKQFLILPLVIGGWFVRQIKLLIVSRNNNHNKRNGVMTDDSEIALLSDTRNDDTKNLNS
mmetsp:Transcript_18266/g.18340  ORF Transcript_18266/g.18340 Transcript_18266/m.18340 type:complete len:542 (-) Transcript_18266:20-1645(-)